MDTFQIAVRALVLLQVAYERRLENNRVHLLEIVKERIQVLDWDGRLLCAPQDFLFLRFRISIHRERRQRQGAPDIHVCQEHPNA